MLTADLVAVSIRGGRLRPRYVDVGSERVRARAAALIEAFEAHVGDTRGALDRATDAHIGDATDFRVQKGLIKLLMDRCTFEVSAPVDPAELRRLVFARAVEMAPITAGDDARLGTPRREVLAAVAEALGLDVAAVDGALFGDLKERQRLVRFEPIDDEALVHRYNTALAQGVLLRATAVEVHLGRAPQKRVRALFRAIKFHGLIHRVYAAEGGGYRVELDGPMSLFRMSTKYGVNMARFLPALLLAEDWRLEATVRWGTSGAPVRFTLSPDDGLVSHARDVGTWVSEEERAFVAGVKKADRGWRVLRAPRLVKLRGGHVVVPDVALKSEDGREALLEIIWFWRRASLAPRLQQLAEGAPPGLMLALSSRLRASEDDLDAVAVPHVRFKGVLPVRKLLDLADAVAVRP